ncbi:class I SAM-dependent methyltransferase [Methylacidiphilum caldifontis]|uniref:class I SAM-dependent methyltransferase n=1 Tax=Methylacidiphilum caldifontis TaxID=2795386 RepID=UPI001A8E7FCE|nr:class I SAM-dependent methyltransferase [Methylacidiphilum caldifontis]QSR88966.1 class I SAM-dependent methyltransferase [Methylacidiphilum caldifontis]
MERILEEQLMADPIQVMAYAQADFSIPHQAVIDRFTDLFPHFKDGVVLDMGCGTADIAIRFARRYPQAKIIGVDGSLAMLSVAQKRIDENHLCSSIKLIQGIFPNWTYPHLFDVLISNSLLHHLPSPKELWTSLRKHAKLGSCVLIIDLVRPESKQQAHFLTETYTQGAHPLLKRDFYNSLLASFTLEEIKREIVAEKLPFRVEQISDRHLMIYGIF